jgi:RHS repeat-associated protein
VAVRALRENYCSNPTLCHSTIERTVWDGDQILYEIRMPGASAESLAVVESDTTTRVGAANAPYGRVAYTYGLQLDAPLSIVRMGYTFDSGHMQQSGAPATFFHDFYGATAVFPHQTWRGDYDIGTFAKGLDRRDAIDARCKTYGLQTFCVTIPWPATNTGFQHQQLSLAPSSSWMGNQIDGRRDGSGLMYMRNRYYDPATARFTQEDPIGLAGGLNLYGFANGDPVSYSDPYGLCPKTARLAPAMAVDGPIPAADAVLALSCLAELGIIGFRVYRTARLAEAAATASDRDGSATTEPTLPDREIVSEDGVTVEHYYRGDEHGPAHMHVRGGGPPTRIGPNGRPLRGDAELTRVQARVVNRNLSAIRRAGNKIGRWLEYKERMSVDK